MEGHHARSSSDSTSKLPSAYPNPLHGSGVASIAPMPLFTSIFHFLSQRLLSFVQDLVLTTGFAVTLNTTWTLAQIPENKARNSSGFPWKWPCTALQCITLSSASPFVESAKTPDKDSSKTPDKESAKTPDKESSNTPSAPPSSSVAKSLLCGESSCLLLTDPAIVAATNNSLATSITPSRYLRTTPHALEVVHNDTQDNGTTQKLEDTQDSYRQQDDIAPVVTSQAPPSRNPIPTPSGPTPSSALPITQTEEGSYDEEVSCDEEESYDEEGLYDEDGLYDELGLYDEEGLYGDLCDIPIDEAVRMYGNGSRAKTTIAMAARMYDHDETFYLCGRAYQKPFRFRCHRDRGQKPRDAYSATMKVGAQVRLAPVG